MKLLGKEISPEALVQAIESRLKARGLSEPAQPIDLEGPEPRVDPMSFYLQGLDANADPTEWLPLHTHRGGLGRSVLLAKWAFRKLAGGALGDVLGRQRVFNGHVRDATLQLYTELQELRRQVAELEGRPPRTRRRRNG